MHERELGYYPGRQHSLADVRISRNRPNEFCGCTSEKRYRDCHMAADDGMTAYERWRDLQSGRRAYLSELARQGRDPHPPMDLVPRHFWS